MSATGKIIGPALALLTANLLAASGAQAQEATANLGQTESDLGLIRLDSALLYYKESGGRVRATEPVASVTINSRAGSSFSTKFTLDTLTGATPNGAPPWAFKQTFSMPVGVAPSTGAGSSATTATVTRSSGGGSLVTLPGSTVVLRQYSAEAHTLPLDQGFRDERRAVDLGGSLLAGLNSRISAGVGYSKEHDFKSAVVNAGVSRDFNEKNTTLSLGVAYEKDTVRPYYGLPTAFADMSRARNGGDDDANEGGNGGGGREGPERPGATRPGAGTVFPTAATATQSLTTRGKSVVSAVFGVTQVMNRYWLIQANYSVGSVTGYQTDPYRILAEVSASTGAPLRYLFESRPENRNRQSLYIGSKVALGQTAASLSARAYHDSWGIGSVTFEAAERAPLSNWFYLEPQLRYYRQSRADFFRGVLIAGQARPAYASSDSRLDAFSAITAGLKAGLTYSNSNPDGRVRNGELYLQIQSYRQKAAAGYAAPGLLAKENLFSGANALALIVGVTAAF